MKGYVFNSLLVAGGSVLGLFAGKRIHENTKDAVFNVLGLVTAFVGLKMRLNGLNSSYFSGKYNTDGFLVASTLFCVGSMTIIGSLKDGLYNDGTLIKTKSVMDGFAALLLASRYGRSVSFSAITVFVIQGGLTLFSGYLTFLTSPRMMNNIDGVGGIIVLAIGLNLLKVKNIKTIDMLPSLVLIVIYGLWRA